MHQDENRLRDALKTIAELAISASTSVPGADVNPYDVHPTDGNRDTAKRSCTLKALPDRLAAKAAATATKINPLNAPASGPYPRLGRQLQSLDPQQIAVLTTKYWGPAPRQLSVSFMESTPADLRSRIVAHMNAWNATAGMSFAETAGVGEIRISRAAGGFSSYLGTDVLLIPANRETMNLEGFTMATPQSEYLRVVRHEAGHTLGFPHEHMRQALVARIDPAKAYPFFLAKHGWDKATVDAQVLTPLSEASLFGTLPDETSIMCYQLDGSITTDGWPIAGGLDINLTDLAFAASIYPKVGLTATRETLEAWPESDDVEVLV
jgi:hypothetical protein